MNQVVFDDLKLRTDNQLKSFVAQPRLQLTWDVNEKHTDFVRFGAGVFASDINNYVIINNLTFDGKHLATVDVRAPNIPTPDFAAYRANYASIPSSGRFPVADHQHDRCRCAGAGNVQSKPVVHPLSYR